MGFEDVYAAQLQRSNKLLKSMEKERVIKRACLFYGYPISINGLWEASAAAQTYSKYDIVVFGDQYQDPAHESHSDTIDVINDLKVLNPECEIFGYVPLGMDDSLADSALPMTEVKNRVDQWIATGATGIFLDEFGFDYYVTRERQNEIVDYCHNNNLNVVANSWQIDYVFKTENMYLDWIDFNGNPNAIAPSISPDDYVMFENMFYYFDDNGDQFVSENWRVYEGYRYLHEGQTEYGGKSFKDQFGTKTFVLDGIVQEDEEKFANGLLGSIILEMDAYSASVAYWGASDSNYIHYPMPKEVDVYAKNGTAQLLDYEGATYTQFQNYLGDDLVKLLWKPEPATVNELDTGVREVYVNNVPIYKRVGPTSQRPKEAKLGFRYFDTTLGQPIYKVDTGWNDATGTSV